MKCSSSGEKIDSKDFLIFHESIGIGVKTILYAPWLHILSTRVIHSKCSKSIGDMCTCGQLCCIINTPLISVSSSRSRSLLLPRHYRVSSFSYIARGSRSFTNRSCLRVARSSNFNQPPNVAHVLGHDALHSLALSVYIYIW